MRQAAVARIDKLTKKVRHLKKEHKRMKKQNLRLKQEQQQQEEAQAIAEARVQELKSRNRQALQTTTVFETELRVPPLEERVYSELETVEV